MCKQCVISLSEDIRYYSQVEKAVNALALEGNHVAKLVKNVCAANVKDLKRQKEIQLIKLN